jgi:hypothetical protein
LKHSTFPNDTAQGWLDHRIAWPQICGCGCPVAGLFGSATGAGECSSVVDGLSLNGAVDGGASDVEQLGEFARGMRAGLVDFHQVALLRH